MKGIHQVFVEYIMASFLYYIHDSDSPLSDAEYDSHCQRLLGEWDTFQHPHKYLVTLDDLRAGTLYHVKEYPLQTQSAAWQWHREILCTP